MHRLPSQTELERARVTRDSSYDGVFFFAVRTTGTFCRPSCPSRRSRPENVEYFATIREALFSGYRPCRRCRPLECTGRPAAWVQRLLDLAERELRMSDARLRQMDIDPARARRYFTQYYGMTYQAYCRGRRMGTAFQQIKSGAGIEAAAVDSGYESSSGFRDAFARILGASPTKAGTASCIFAQWIESPLGPLVAGANDDGLCLLEFSDRRIIETQLETIRQRFRGAIVPGTHPHLTQISTELAEYFAGSRRKFETAIVYPGSAFQQQVWSALLDIPYGETRSYEDLARAIGRPSACRAVGHANGLNRICIVIPCHRVVNKGGRLGGYGGGLWRKQFLLDLERGAPAHTKPKNT